MMAVYLLHFSAKLSHAQHYCGFTNGESVAARVARHQAGDGARICAAAVEAGLALELARVWPDGDRELERWIKRQKNHRRFCPICRGEVND